MRVGYAWAAVVWATSPTIAWGAEVAVFAGARDAVDASGITQGPQGGLRVGLARWEVAVGAFARLRPVGPSALTQVLVERLTAADPGSAFVVPEDSDSASGYALVSWGPVAPEQRWWGAPRLVVGAEARSVVRRTYTDDEGSAAEAERTTLLGVGPVAGVAFDARLGIPLGARLSLLDRTWFGPERTATFDGVGEDSRLFHSPTFTLDLSWRL